MNASGLTDVGPHSDRSASEMSDTRRAGISDAIADVNTMTTAILKNVNGSRATVLNRNRVRMVAAP